MKKNEVGFMKFSKDQREQLSDVMDIKQNIVNFHVGSSDSCKQSHVQLIAANLSDGFDDFHLGDKMENQFSTEPVTCEGKTPGTMSKFRPDTDTFLVDSRKALIKFARHVRKPCHDQEKELSDKTLVMHMR